MREPWRSRTGGRRSVVRPAHDASRDGRSGDRGSHADPPANPAHDHRGRDPARGDLDLAARDHVDPDRDLPRARARSARLVHPAPDRPAPHVRDRALVPRDRAGRSSGSGRRSSRTSWTRSTASSTRRPSYVEDLTKGRGRLGFLERKYQIVEKVQEQVNKGDAAKRLFGFSDTAVAVTKGILTLIAAVVTIFFLTFFLLLEGGAWVERFYTPLTRAHAAALETGRPRHPQDHRRLHHRQPADQPRRRLHVDDRAARDGRAVRGRARPARRDPRPDPACGRHARRDHRRHDRVPPLGARPGSCCSPS